MSEYSKYLIFVEQSIVQVHQKMSETEKELILYESKEL